MIDFYSKNVSASIEDFRSSHSEWTMSSSIIFSNIEICVLSCLTSGHNFVNSLNFKFIRWPMQQNKNSWRENILKSILIDLSVDFWIQNLPQATELNIFGGYMTWTQIKNVILNNWGFSCRFIAENMKITNFREIYFQPSIAISNCHKNSISTVQQNDEAKNRLHAFE